MSDHADDDTKKEALSTHFLDSDDDDEKQMRGNGREENDDDAFLAKYDSDGYGDEADRAQLMQMNELDREEELAKRSAKLKILKDRKRILEKAKEREEKERNKGRQQQGRERLRQGEDEKSKKALEEIGKKVKKRIDEAGLSSDDDLSSSSGLSYDDEGRLDSEDEEEMLERKKRGRTSRATKGRRKKQKKKTSSRRRGGDYSDDESSSSDGFGYDDDMDVFEEATAKDVRAITLPRFKLEKWISEPFYESAVEGAFVRVNIGLDKNKESRYRLCQIAGIADGSYRGTTQTYTLKAYEYNDGTNAKKSTNKWLILRWGSHEKTFRISETSNRIDDAFARANDESTTIASTGSLILDHDDERFKNSEFGKWYDHVKKTAKKYLPSVDDCEIISKKLTGADEYRYTAEDVQKMLELNKQKRGGRSTNFIFEKEQMKMQLAKAREEGDIEQQEKLELAIEELNVKIEDKINKRGGNQKLMADINKKNEFSNAIKLSQAAVKHIKKVKEGKDISDDDPFSRRPTRVTTYWSMKTDGENNSKGATTTAANRAAANAAAATGKEEHKKEEKDEEDALANYKTMKEKLCDSLHHISKSHQFAQSKLLNSSNGMKPSLTHAKRATERDPVLVRQRFAAGRMTSNEGSKTLTGNSLSVKEYLARQEAKGEA